MIAYVGCSRVLKGRVKERRKEKEQRVYQGPPLNPTSGSWHEA